ncbi:molybdopterin-dependent oxidoreductase [Spirosoma radiotolerans]|uniref:Oxidoreductase molybdopterin-binding domain-containing protein n=1 Tax=Spirosoma radiotolerans TaxID=1379870 RepID=A0A0E3ZVC4_9BACT|nr:molybdopterin-dependent oxidoreductase [Spirosoma radiotolerans]AKD55719.1 hypothetical protein SD10_13215 [Spirosoma radiotolerans]
MFFQRVTLLTSCFFVLLIPYTQAQTVSAALLLKGPSGQSVSIPATVINKLPHIEHQGKDHDGQEHTYTGVPLATLLKQVDAPLGGRLRGKALANYLLVGAKDGYQVVFALPELDSVFTKQVIFLADRRDGQPLPAEQGPYRIVVPQETKQARWVRQVTTLTVLTAKE